MAVAGDGVKNMAAVAATAKAAERTRLDIGESLPDHVDRVHPVSTGGARQPCEQAEFDSPAGSRRIDAHMTRRRRPAPLNRLEGAAEEDLDLGHLAVTDGAYLDVAVALPALERFVLIADEDVVTLGRDDIDEPVRFEQRGR